MTAVFAQSLAFNTLAGTAGVSNPFSNSAPVTFNNPQGVAVDAAGNVYVADTTNHVIRKITAAGAVSTLVGANGSAGLVNDGTANASAARFSSPRGLAIDSTGTKLYVADTGNNAIRVITLAAAGGSVTGVATVAGSATGASGSTNAGAASLFNSPIGIVIDAADANLYIADSGNQLIRKIVIAGPTVSTVAGILNTTTFANGDSATATFNSPSGLALNAAGDVLYVADYNNHVIRRVALGTVAVTTLAGTAGTAGFVNGNGVAAQFRNPSGVALDPSGNVYVVDFGNNALRHIAVASTNAVTTPAGPAATGTITPGASGVANGTGNDVRFTGPIGIATKTVSAVPYVYIADTNSHLIRQGATAALPTVSAASPATQTVSAGADVTFTATVTGGWPTPALKWQILPAGTGTWVDLTASSTYLNVTTTALTINDVTNAMNNDKVRLVATTSSAVMGVEGTLVVNQPPTFSSGSVNFNAVAGLASTFLVKANGSGTITYSVTGGSLTPAFTLASNGFITGTPTSTADSVSATITATNGVAPDATQVVTINVLAAGSAQVPTITSASSQTFLTGQNNSFTFTASGVPTPIIGVSGSLPAGVTVSNGVLSGVPLNTDNSPFTLTVTATNSVGSTNQTFTLAVSAAATAPTFVTQPQNAIANLDQAATFTASAIGSPNPTLRWQRQSSGSSGGFADLFDDGTYSGTSTGTLTVSNLAAGMSGDQFRLVANNTTGTATSSVATLVVNVGTTIATFAGAAGQSGATDATGTAARFNTPSSIAVDAAGNFYVADSANHVIRKISSAGVVTTLAGLAGSNGFADGAGATARFNGPSALAVTAVGTIYVADTYNHVIRTISPAGVVATIAGSPNTVGSADGIGTVARFSFPSGIAVDAAANIYVADTSNHTIRRVLLNGSVSTFAGAAGISGSSDHTTGTSARFNLPTGLAVGADGNLYVADSSSHTIRRVTPTTTVTTVAGTAGIAGSTDAISTAASFSRPNGVALDSAGNIYVADTSNNTIRRIATTGAVTTIAGFPGAIGSLDGSGSLARFNEPFAITVDTNGNLFIADTRNHTIRRSGTTAAPGVATQPQNRVAPAGSSVTFSVVATGTPAPSYQWQRQAAGTVGFVNLANNFFYSGVNTANLTVLNLLSAYSGDQFRVFLTNGVNPAATSDAATLTIGDGPAITSAATATVRATEAFTFTVTASGTPAPTFSISGQPVWLSLNSASGVLSGTPPAGAEGTYNFTLTASNGVPATQAFTLTVTPAVVPPSITTQPVAASVNQGQSATFTAVASGTAPLSYQWRRGGVIIAGATGASYTVGNAQPTSAGLYTVVVTNVAGTVTSNPAELVINTAPVFTSQPRTQIALAGSTVTLGTSATGGTSLTYQWRKNGTAIDGATNSTLTLTGVTASDAGIYDVVVTNALGSVVSSAAQLSVSTVASAPVVTAQPASRVVVAGGATSLSVSATGAPAPSYQWRKDGGLIFGANSPTLSFANAQASDAGTYDVVVTNSMGIVTTRPANLRVIARSYAGIYLGTFSGVGDFGLYVREDNSAALIGYLGGSLRVPVVARNLVIDDAGQFSFQQAASTGVPAVSGSITIGVDGSVSGSIGGAAAASIVGTRVSDTGTSQAYAGFYQAGATGNGTSAYAVVGANGQAHVVVVSAGASNGGLGSVSNAGQVTLATPFGTAGFVIDPVTGVIVGTSTIGSVVATLNGGSDAAIMRQRLVNISSRARIAGGDSVAIAGFVIAGEESKPVLIRAVGPTLSSFNLTGVLASPRLELFSGQLSLGANAGIGSERAAIDAAGARAAAFTLGSAGTDAAILTTLAPGNYTAVVSGTGTAAGIALVEVYDLSAPAPGQKMLNISTRAAVGTGDNILIAGFVVPDGSAKRVLIRGVGPGLAPFNVAGLLAQPTVTLLNNANQAVLAQNTNWTTSADAAAITAASTQVGAFGLTNNDSAIIVTLPPGNYSAQVSGVGTSTGVALIEVYELP